MAVCYQIVLLVLITIQGFSTNRVNIALNKPASQSSLGPRSQTRNGFAWKAVDGDTNGIFNKGSCSHNDKEFVNGTEWLQVNLEDLYNVTEIIVYGRTDSCCLTWLDDYVLYSGVNCESGICYEECYQYNKTGELIKVNSIPGGCVAQYIRLSIIIDKSLVLCEVEIFGELIPVVSSTLLSSTVSSGGNGMVASTEQQMVTETSTETSSFYTNANSFVQTTVEPSPTDSLQITSFTSDLVYTNADTDAFSSFHTLVSLTQSQIISSSSYMNGANSETESLSLSSSLLISLGQSATMSPSFNEETTDSSPESISPTMSMSFDNTMTQNSISHSSFTTTSSTQKESNYVQTSGMSQFATSASPTMEISTAVGITCPCFCSQLSLSEIEGKLKHIINNLILPKETLSSVRRKKETADDNRLSAVVTGYTGAVILCCVFGFLVSGDVVTVFKLIVICFRKKVTFAYR